MKRILAFVIVLCMLGGNAFARKVTGSVRCGEVKLEGVIVTDGENFAQTGRNGKFTLDINDDAEYVYIVTPSGYVADWSTGVPAFYKAAPGEDKFEFDLKRTAGGDVYSILAIADPQTYSDEHFAEFAGKPMEELSRTAAQMDGVAVGLALGDISWDRIEVLDMYKKEIVRTGIPFYPVVGNHDYEAYVKGDKEAGASYRRKMGPENYAFCLGNDVVIVLDNIIYDTDFKMTSGYTDEVISWLRGLMRLVPADADIYIAQHVPFGQGRRKIQNANRVLELVRGHKVTILSGHTHVNSIREIEKNVTEHNVAALCGAWWDTMHCSDGTPRGFKVFTKSGNMFSWYYKPVDFSKRHIAEAYGLGEAPMHPNSVVVNVWDWDPAWKVEWYEDGKHMGKMDQVREVSPVFSKEIAEAYAAYGEEIPGWKRARASAHNFEAVPSRYARMVTVSVESRFGQKWTQTIDLENTLDIQMTCSDVTMDNLRAIADKGVNTIDLDVYVDMQGNVMAGGPDGIELGALIDTLDSYTEVRGLSKLRYTVEMKTVKGPQEGKSVPYYHDFVDDCMNVLWPKFLGDRLIIKGSDHRALNHLKMKYPEVYVAFDLPAEFTDIESAMSRLNFKPKWINALHKTVDQTFVDECHKKGYHVSVWGTDDPSDITRLRTFGIDSVIKTY